jgi:hypothetical protein
VYYDVVAASLLELTMNYFDFDSDGQGTVLGLC